MLRNLKRGRRVPSARAAQLGTPAGFTVRRKLIGRALFWRDGILIGLSVRRWRIMDIRDVQARFHVTGGGFVRVRG